MSAYYKKSLLLPEGDVLHIWKPIHQSQLEFQFEAWEHLGLIAQSPSIVPYRHW